MKQKYKAFTIAETVIVLGLVALLLSLALSFRPPTTTVNWTTFEQAFAGHLQKARLLGQIHNRDSYLFFQHNKLLVNQEELNYPPGAYLDQEQIIRIKASGYVRPGHLLWHQGQRMVQLIFQFGGGTYRFEEKMPKK